MLNLKIIWDSHFGKINTIFSNLHFMIQHFKGKPPKNLEMRQHLICVG